MIYKNEKRELEKPFWLKEIKKKRNIETKSEKQTKAFKTVKMEKKQIVPSKLLWKWFHLNDNTKLQPRVKKLSYQTSRLLYKKVFGFPIRNAAISPFPIYKRDYNSYCPKWQQTSILTMNNSWIPLKVQLQTISYFHKVRNNLTNVRNTSTLSWISNDNLFSKGTWYLM